MSNFCEGEKASATVLNTYILSSESLLDLSGLNKGQAQARSSPRLSVKLKLLIRLSLIRATARVDALPGACGCCVDLSRYRGITQMVSRVGENVSLTKVPSAHAHGIAVLRVPECAASTR